MAELNPIIRNAIATALHAITNADDPRCRQFLSFQQLLVPDYWVRPELLPDITEISAAGAAS